jgi:hypothetical protein
MRKSSETSVCDPHSRCESLVLNPGALLRNTCLSLCLDLSFRRPGSQNVLLPGSGERIPSPSAGGGSEARCRRGVRGRFGGGAPEMIQIQLNAGNQAFRAGFAGWFRACWLVQSLLFSRCRPDCSLSLPTRPCFSVQVDALEFALLGSAISEPNA